MDVGELGAQLETILKDALEAVEKGEITTTKPASEIGGFDELKRIQTEASSRSAALTFSDLEKWISKHTSAPESMRKMMPEIKKIVEGIELGTYEEAAVQTFTSEMGIGHFFDLDPARRDLELSRSQIKSESQASAKSLPQSRTFQQSLRRRN